MRVPVRRVPYAGPPVRAIPYVAAPSADAVNYGLGATGSGVNWLMLGAAAVAAWLLFRGRKSVSPPESKRSSGRIAGGAGWYAIGYNYPRGHRDRRIKLVDGPFDTKAEALDAKAEADPPFYVTVSKRRQAP
jgi:hypothetical protein